MKQVHLFAAAAMLALAILIGCAGDDNSGSPATTGNNVINATPRIEAVVKIDRTNLLHEGAWLDRVAQELYKKDFGALNATQRAAVDERLDAYLMDPDKMNPADATYGLINPTLYGVQDPRNMQTGEQYWFELVRYVNGQRQILDGATWSLSDPKFANIGANSGLFLAGDAATQGNQFVFANYQNARYEAEYSIKPRQVRLIGRVLQEDNMKPLPGVELFFYDNFGTLVGRVRSSYQGTFRASVPTNTSQFTPTVESIPNAFYQTFLYANYKVLTLGTAATFRLQVTANGTTTETGDLTTATLTAAQLQSELESLSNVGAGNVQVTKVDGTFRIRFVNRLENRGVQVAVTDVSAGGTAPSVSDAGIRYSVGYPQCKATLPPLEAGTTVLINDILIRARVEGQPTPPPTGCSID